MKTKDRILMTSIELFNRHGIVAVTTNHIAKALDMSPGNLYFHFSNKEEIVRALFKIMCQETYDLWRAQKRDNLLHPLDLIEKNFEIYWRYRFFHREMYYLRRKDAQLAKLWKAHIRKVLRLMTLVYRQWIDKDWMRPMESVKEMNFMANVLLATASTFLQFFESAERQPVRSHVALGRVYVARLLIHWTRGSMHGEFEKFITRSEKGSADA
ncbi:MAG: TetR/AcrR family transcriptional regulator [Bdellovibrio sp.]|nr:MAG: TetR/AcrR family transcriptional regulator [Bdellovibrio sp.]